MKSVTLSATILSLILVGCSDEESPTVSQADSPTTEDGSQTTFKPVLDEPVTGNDAEREIGEAINTTVELTKQKRDEYAADLDRRLEDLDAEIAVLEEKAGDLEDDVKKKWDEQMKVLREKRKAMVQKLTELKGSSAEAWQELKTGMDSTWTELRKGVSDAASEFDDKGAEGDNSSSESEAK